MGMSKLTFDQCSGGRPNKIGGGYRRSCGGGAARVAGRVLIGGAGWVAPENSGLVSGGRCRGGVLIGAAGGQLRRAWAGGFSPTGPIQKRHFARFADRSAAIVGAVKLERPAQTGLEAGYFAVCRKPDRLSRTASIDAAGGLPTPLIDAADRLAPLARAAPVLLPVAYASAGSGQKLAKPATASLSCLKDVPSAQTRDFNYEKMGSGERSDNRRAGSKGGARTVRNQGFKMGRGQGLAFDAVSGGQDLKLCAGGCDVN